MPILKMRRPRLRVGQEARLPLRVTTPLCPKASASSSQSTVRLGHWVEAELMSINGK